MSEIKPYILPFTAIDGDNIVMHEWPLLYPDLPPRAGVIVMHTLEEYGLRMRKVSQFFVEQGFAVRSYDMYGHGESDGKKGTLPPQNRFVVDLCDMVDEMRRVHPKGMPIILYGHGFSALLAGHVAYHKHAEIDSVIMVSPAFRSESSLWQKMLLAIIPKVAPNLVINGRPNPKHMTHSQEEVEAYANDKHCHHNVTANLVGYLLDLGQKTEKLASEWHTPTLLLYAGSDKIVDPKATANFAKKANAFIESKCFRHMYHDIFREPDAELAFDALRQWLNKRYAKHPAMDI